MHWLTWLFDSHIAIGAYTILWREVVGNGFGFLSAIGGLRRRIWAWPVGIVGNVLLFTVFMAATFEADTRQPLFGQAFRQIFFIITSVYGWYRWRQTQREHGPGKPAVTPRWATAKERIAYLFVWVAGVAVVQGVFAAVGAGWPAPRWYYWCDAWIFIGSIVATYAMARGWNDFWLCWIAVDIVGVPLLFHSNYIPSGVLYIAYGALVIYGFFVWLRASRQEGLSPSERPAVEKAPTSA
jgi:nicotinamide mononucleotide transporter